ncbi:MAG: hydrogenase maturation nickel metallochaperone HypA [Mycobacteriales bacterium]
MHELGYCEGVVDAVERRAAGRPVARVGVRVGALHRFQPAAFEQSFQLVAMGGVADGATTELVIVPTSAHCRSCANDFESIDSSPACPSCGSLDLDVTGGDELVLEWVEYRESATTPPLVRAEGS